MIQNPNSIKLEKSDEKITAQSGLLLIGEAIEKYSLKEMFQTKLPLPGSNRGNKPEDYLIPMLLNFAGGGITMEDVLKIFEDKAICKMLNLKSFESGTLEKWLKRTSDQGFSRKLEDIADNFNQIIIQKANIQSLTLDVDAMGIESNKSTAEWTYKNYKGYMPLLAFIPELALNVFAKFQTGNTSPRAGILESIKKCVKTMPEGYKYENYRSDAASYSADIINYLDEEKIRYTITAVLNNAIKKDITEIAEKKWATLYDEKGDATDREYAEIIYTMQKTKNAFRVIIQRNRNQQLDLFEDGKQRHYAIATNINDSSAPEIISWHNKRGNSENYNKEAKNGVSLNYLPTSNFKANELWFLVGILAYNVFQAIKLLVLPETWSRKKIATIRWQLIQIPGKLVYHARQYKLKLCSISQEVFNIFKDARTELCVT